MKRKLYSIKNEEEILIFEDATNEKEQVIYYKDYLSKPILEKKYIYNEKGFLINEIDQVEGGESTRTEIEYNNDSKLLTRKTYINEELYEETKIIYNDNEEITKSFIEGVETSKVIVTENENETICEYYEDGLLTNKNHSYYDDEKKLDTIKFHNIVDNTQYIEYNEYNQSDQLLSKKVYSQTNELLTEIVNCYKKDLIVSSKEIYYNNDKQGLRYLYEYDLNDNLIKIEIKDLTDITRELYIAEYDKEGRIIEERGYSKGNIDQDYSYYLIHYLNTDFHIIHKYE